MTKLIRGLHNVKPQDKGSVLTIGNFDGVHVGHQALLKLLKEKAQALHSQAMVMIFEPQPLEFYGKGKIKVPRLTRMREKYEALSPLVDQVLLAYFNPSFAALSPEDFVVQVLVKTLGVTHLMVGEDFRFGHKRSGDLPQLQALADQHGFSVEIIQPILTGGERVSSTGLRQALAKDEQAVVLKYLGHPYSMSGRVAAGQELGRQWGFPTANIELHRALTPIQGVYAVRVYGLAAEPLPGVANLGIRPTVDGTRTLLEVHLLDFNQNIYHRHVRVEFCEKLREEQRFETVDLLREQIAQDVIQARAYFDKAGKSYA
ncbi:MAG TPA: bifunctional riboflavin kinase/FAD synthetase [Gammaproteobacteria bacterium]|nr:bifunctional riboflavin kinase/FAD synthetase [Gammaproteobacteria bacterium]